MNPNLFRILIRCQGALRHRLRHDVVPQEYLYPLRPAELNGPVRPVGLHRNQQTWYRSVRIRQNRLLVSDDRSVHCALTLSTVSVAIRSSGLGFYEGGRAHDVTLSPSCYKSQAGTIYMHELMHRVGLHHEHTRPDRDTYVEILWDKIDAGESDSLTTRLIMQ